MSWTRTPADDEPGTALIASFDGTHDYYAPTRDAAALNPIRVGKKSDLFSRVTAPLSEHEEAERLIRMQKARALIVDLGPTAKVSELVGTLPA